MTRIAQGPDAARRHIGKAAFVQTVRSAINGQFDLTCGDKQGALRTGVGFRRVRAAAGLQLDDVLRKGFGKSAERAGNHPHAHAVPAGQDRGDDVLHGALWNDGIGLREHGAPCQQLILGGMAAGWGKVTAVRHRSLILLGHNGLLPIRLFAGPGSGSGSVGSFPELWACAAPAPRRERAKTTFVIF